MWAMSLASPKHGGHPCRIAQAPGVDYTDPTPVERGMDRFFADAAAGRVPIQRPASDPEALAALAAFSARYDFELAAFPADAGDVTG